PPAPAPEPEPEPVKYKLSVRCEDGGSVVSCAGDKTDFTAGERCMLTALPADGYTFGGWTGDVTSSEKNICVTFDSDIFLSASFDKIPPAPAPDPEPEPVKYKLSVRCETGGSVVSSAGDKTDFTAGERCMLTALPADGYTFGGWTGDVGSFDKTICVTFDSDIFLSASFDKIPPAPAPDPEPEPVKYKLSVRCETGGSVVSSAGDKTDFTAGERCMLTALPADGYTFGGWTGDVTSSEKNICVTLDSDIFLSASFDKIPPAPAPEPEPEPVKYKLSVRCETGGSVVSSAGAKTDFTAGERCMLTALPADGYTFGGWTGDVTSSEKNICVTLDSDIFLSASFDKIPPEVRYSLSVNSVGAGNLEVNPLKTDYSAGELVTINALPASGHMFTYWNDGVESMSRTVVMNDDKTLTAQFKKRNWTIVVYMAADNDLESSAILDMNEMEASDFMEGGLTVLALVDRAEGYDGTNGNWTDTRLYEIKHDDDGLNGNIISKRLSCNTLGLFDDTESELNMADSNVLYNVIRFAMKKYQADNYGLIMWGHGTGWRGGASASDTAASSLKSLAFDDYSSSYMTIAQVHQALVPLPEKLSFLGFDTCYGALLETAWEFRNDAVYMVGSGNSVPSNGWNYQTFLDAAAITDMSPDNIASCAVSSFAEQYEGLSSASISKIRLENIEGLKSAFEKFTASVVSGIDSAPVSQNLRSCITNDVVSYSYAGSASDMFIDMYSFVKQVNASRDTIFSNQSLIEGMEYRQSNFVTALNKAVSSWSGDGSRNARLSIFFAPLTAGGLPTSSFSPAYIKNSGDLTQSSFVKDSTNWVPDKNTSAATLLNKIFFTSF
nr:hypothetical protein [Treponemataceae bacterium]